MSMMFRATRPNRNVGSRGKKIGAGKILGLRKVPMQEDTHNLTTVEPAKLALAGMRPEEIAAEIGVKAFQARQIFQWIHGKQAAQFEEMTNLSLGLRSRLAKEYVVHSLECVNTSASENGSTMKMLFRMHDGETVESVLIREKKRTTLCLSTQAGCPLKCSFCATGLSGFSRNLFVSEIVGQALSLLREENLEGRTPNIVFMGMGEPFRNYDATVSAIRLLMHSEGLGIGARRITVSTVGEVEGIKRFAEEDWQVRLSVSLHAARDELRRELVPLNRRHNLEALMDAVRDYFEATGRHVTFEWTLIAGVNDTSRDVAELSGMLRGLQSSVNLIPYNPVEGLDYEAPSRRSCERFARELHAKGINTTLRAEKGRDINAACGQLRRAREIAQS